MTTGLKVYIKTKIIFTHTPQYKLCYKVFIYDLLAAKSQIFPLQCPDISPCRSRI